MTTPGPVANQVAPTKAAYGGARDSGAKSDPAAGKGEAGFGEVLTKMQRDDAPATGAKRGARATDSAQGDSQQRAAADGAVRASIELVLDSLAGDDEQLPEDQQLDTAPPNAQPQAPMNDIIAAAAAAVPAQPATHAPPDAAAGETQVRGSKPAAATMALVDVGAGNTAANESAATPDEPAASQTFAAPTDPDIVRAGTQVIGPEKGKSERKAARIEEPHASVSTAQADPSDGKAASPPAKASVVRQEAHFAPVTPAGPRTSAASKDAAPATNGPEPIDADNANAPTIDALLPSPDDIQPPTARPAQQIADGILAEAGSAAAGTERANLASDQPGMKPVLKVLHIQLQPADLGTVTVRMELKDAELSLQVEADRAETVDMIRNDQDTLSKLLRSAGYSLDAASVRVIEVDRSAASQQAGQGGAQSSFQSSPQSQSGASARQDQPQRGSAGTNSGGAAPQTTRNDSYESNSSRAGRGLYL